MMMMMVWLWGRTGRESTLCTRRRCMLEDERIRGTVIKTVQHWGLEPGCGSSRRHNWVVVVVVVVPSRTRTNAIITRPGRRPRTLPVAGTVTLKQINTCVHTTLCPWFARQPVGRQSSPAPPTPPPYVPTTTVEADGPASSGRCTPRPDSQA